MNRPAIAERARALAQACLELAVEYSDGSAAPRGKGLAWRSGEAVCAFGCALARAGFVHPGSISMNVSALTIYLLGGDLGIREVEVVIGACGLAHALDELELANDRGPAPATAHRALRCSPRLAALAGELRLFAAAIERG